MTNEQMKQKIEELCKELRINLYWITVVPNRANRHLRKVEVKETADSGDFAVALHEIGHVECDPDNKLATYLEKLDAETDAWKWALERNNNNYDAEGWKRLHASLYAYYRSVMDPSHPAHQLLMEAERQNSAIRPRISSLGVPSLARRSRKTERQE